MLLSKLEIVVIVSVISFLGGAIFGETQTTLPTSTAATVLTEIKGKYLFNAEKKCECGKTVSNKLYLN